MLLLVTRVGSVIKKKLASLKDFEEARGGTAEFCFIYLMFNVLLSH